MAYFLAVDAGGTKTDYALADETRTLARVRSGTIKRMRADAGTTAKHLDAALHELAFESGVSLREVTRTCIGTAGETVPLVTDWLREAFRERVGGELVLVGDVEIALDAAFQGGPGVLVLAGTGSNVAGRGTDNKIARAGGWGPALADQGSGHRIGLEALRAGFLAKDEVRPTTLLAKAAEFWGLGYEEQLIEYANAIPAPDFSRLTHLVLACAEAGDAVAGEVLRREGEGLAYLVKVVMRRIGMVPPMAFTGSIMEKVLPVRQALVASVRQEFLAAEEMPGVIDPLDGALWRARQTE